jgi:predicted ATPase/transcriptional regulator with XRE-family HTH domain
MLTLRTTIGLTQSGLADYLGVSRRTIGDWEAGNNYPKAEHLKRFIELAARQRALTHGREEEEIRALWRLAQQKVLLDGAWLASLLAAPPPEMTATVMHVPDPIAPKAEAALLRDDSSPSAHRPAIDEPAVKERKVALGERTINLPPQSTTFLGREAELAEITRTLADPACHLLTLLGPGGVGKTRLAIEVASRIAGSLSQGRDKENANAYRDGVVFVPLASVSRLNQIAASIGEALHLSFAGQQDPTAYLLDYLRDRRMLLVLDNFEHLLDGADLVARILANSPHVTILTTSRERLNIQAEWLFDVEGLSYPVESGELIVDSREKTLTDSRPAGEPLLATMGGYSAMQLFVQRATQVRPDLPLTDSTLITIARISRHVAGMPLAIELAAAGARIRSIDEIEEEIRTNLDALATTFRDVPPRHRSLRAAFDHSWNLLSEPERELFSRLAVFRGDYSLEAAEQVAGGRLPLLTALVDKSLLRQSSLPPRQSAGLPAPNNVPETRFVMLEPIREYALEKLTERGELETLQRAHAEYYREIAEAAEAQWNSPTAAAAIARVDRDYDNIRAALGWARGRRTSGTREDGGDLTTGLRLAAALRRYWQRRGYSIEGRAWLEDLLARDDSSRRDGQVVGDPSAGSGQALAAGDSDYLTARLHAVQATAWLASDQHDYARSEELFEQSTALRRILGESESQPAVLVNAARRARAAGQYGQSIALLEDALSRLRAVGDRGGWSTGGIGIVLYELALVLRERGDYAGASALFRENLDRHRELEDREDTAVGLMGLGDIARDQADPTQIRKYCEQSLTISRELGLQWAIGFLLNNLAWAAYLDNDLPKASNLISESVGLFREVRAESSLGEVLITHGHILRAQGDAAGAYRAMTESLGIVQSLGPRVMLPFVLEGLAGLLAQQRQAHLGVQLLGAAGAVRAQMGTPARPLDKVLENRELSSARSSLGAGIFAQLQEEGERVPLEQLLGTIPSQASFEALPAESVLSSTEYRVPSTEYRAIQPATDPDTQPTLGTERHPRVDWGDALTGQKFYGREWELAMLTQWVAEERCRVVSVLGPGGIGKSALSTTLAHRLVPDFDVVVWRSVRDAPSCESLIDECLQVISPEALGLTQLRETGGAWGVLDPRINLLLKQLQSKRTLIVLDNTESLLDEGDRAGYMRAGYEGYGRLLLRLAEGDHRSCLLLTGREKLEDLAPLEGSNSPVRVLRLSRLGPAACAQLLAEKGVDGTQSEQGQLIEQYGGNPLALKIVAQTIVDLFGGDAAEFEKQGEVIYGGVRELLAEQFERLSPVQRSIMYWLTILREPCTLDEIVALTVTPMPRVRLLDGLEALYRSSLIEPGGTRGGTSKAGSFTLQSVVLEYMTERLIGEVSREIEQGEPRLLNEHGLVLAQAPEYIRQTQERLIVTPILQRLRATYRQQGAVEEQLQSLLSNLATLAVDVQGYGPANLAALLLKQRGNLRGASIDGMM